MFSQRQRRIRDRQERLRRIRQQIADLGYICSGSLIRRTKVCGKPGCACATDPRARHGPYYEWSHKDKDRRVCTSLPEDVALDLARAIRNQRRLRRLMRLWEEESARAVLEAAARKSQ